MSVSNEHDQSEIQFQNTDQKVKKNTKTTACYKIIRWNSVLCTRNSKLTFISIKI